MINTVAIVSLSAGTIGEDFVAHEVSLGVRRLEDYGLKVKMMPHAMKGITYIKENPDKRAEDLLAAFSDPDVDMILCAIGGDDTYRLLPYLFDNGELQKAITEKIFLGFSDTTWNHFMLHKLGLKTFYGQSFLADICEMAPTMLPYSKKHFEELIQTGTIREIRPADLWYEGRTDWSAEALGTISPSHRNQGFQLLQGAHRFEGEILGGCIDSLYDFFDNTRYPDTVALCRKYNLFPSCEDWGGRILLLETSEEQPEPELYRKQLEALKSTGIFGVISGILLGKPMDEKYFEEYKRIICDVVSDDSLPILANVNVGHATPRCIIPFGVHAVVDADAQIISFEP